MSEAAVRSRALIFVSAFSLLAACSVSEPGSLGSVFLPAPEDPQVHFRVLVKVGSVNDPSGKDGLCLLTWDLVANGASRTSTAAEIASRLERLGAKISVTVDREASVFGADIARENLNAFYAIFKEILLAPGLQADDLELLRSDRILRFEIPSNEEDVRVFARDALDRLVYDGHPYGRPSAEAAATIAGMTNVDARVFYNQHFVRGNIVIGLGGSYPPDFPDRILTDFKLVPAGFTPALRLPAPKRPAGLEILIAEMPAPRVEAAIGTPLDPGLTDEGAAALGIAAAYLGQDPKISLAPDRFRRQRIFPVPLSGSGGTDPVAAIPAALESFRALVDEGIPAERFDPVRKSVFNETRLAAGKTGDRALDLAAALAPPKESAGTARELVILVDLTKPEADQAVRRYLDPGRVAIAVVTADAGSARRFLAAALPSANIRVAPAAEIFRPAAEARSERAGEK